MAVSRRRLFYQGIAVNLTNPKTMVFLVALLPQFLDPKGDYALQMMTLSSITLLMDGMVMVGYVLLASRLAKYSAKVTSMSWVNRLFGGLFMGCGLLLASSRL